MKKNSELINLHKAADKSFYKLINKIKKKYEGCKLVIPNPLDEDIEFHVHTRDDDGFLLMEVNVGYNYLGFGCIYKGSDIYRAIAYDGDDRDEFVGAELRAEDEYSWIECYPDELFDILKYVSEHEYLFIKNKYYKRR